MKVLMLRGIPASGKSTYAKKLVEESGGKWKRLNKDDLRNMVDSAYSKERERLINKLQEFMLRTLLKEGYSVVIDNTHVYKFEYYKNLYQTIAGLVGAEFEIKHFDCTLDEALKRNYLRGQTVPDKVIIKMFYELNNPPTPTYHDPTLPPAIICDIDGTIAIKTGDRSPFDMTRVSEDEPRQEIIDIIDSMKYDNNIIFLSGRSDDAFDDTFDWLRKYVITDPVEPINLYMRKEGDTRKDSIIKREMYEEHIENKYDVKFVLDDRRQVVNEWRAMGLLCLEVADHRF